MYGKNGMDYRRLQRPGAAYGDGPGEKGLSGGGRRPFLWKGRKQGGRMPVPAAGCDTGSKHCIFYCGGKGKLWPAGYSDKLRRGAESVRLRKLRPRRSGKGDGGQFPGPGENDIPCAPPDAGKGPGKDHQFFLHQRPDGHPLPGGLCGQQARHRRLFRMPAIGMPAPRH